MKRLGRAVEVLAWAVFFVLAALVLAVRFWLLPDIERYREEIVGAVSAAVGQSGRIGGLSAGRYGLKPHLHLRDARIFVRAGRGVSAAVGQPVRLGGLSAGWYGLNPHIPLRDVRIFDRAGREALTLPSIDNQLAWSSLLQGKLKLHSLAIDKLRLQVRRDAEGALYVAGIKLGDRDGGFARWLLAQDEIGLGDAH